MKHEMTHDKNITRYNHYVPRMYLKNWSQDGKTIWTYSILVQSATVPYWRKESIKSASAWKDFYTQKINGSDIDDFERWFDVEFEAPAKSVRDKIISGTVLTGQDNITLSKYIAAQYVRTPARLEKILALGRASFPGILQETLKKVASGSYINKRDTAKIANTDIGSMPLKIDVDYDEKTLSASSVVGKSLYLDSVKYILTHSLNQMFRYRWHIIYAANNISFPTSDDPVACLNFTSFEDFNFNGGLLKKNSIILMPISPKHIAITQVGCNYPFEKLSDSLKWCEFLRKVIIKHAHRFVYADSPQRGMLALNPRVANAELYKAEQSDMKNWHVVHTEAEEALLKQKN